MRLFVLLTLAITGAIVLGLERSLAANMNLITPNANSENLQAGLPSREQLSRIGVAEVREFLNRRQLQRTPPRFTDSFSAYQKAYLKRVGEMKMGQMQGCSAGYANTSISVRTPATTWSQAQCSREEAPKETEKHFEWSNLIPSAFYQYNGSNIVMPGEPSVERDYTRDNILCPLVPTTRFEFNRTVKQPQLQPKTLQQVLLPSQQLQPARPNQLLMIKPQSPCTPSSTRPCKPASQMRPTKAPRSVRPTKTLPIKPTTVVKPVPKYSTQKSPSIYRNYSVMKVYHDRSLRRDPKPCFLPSKSVFPSKKVVEKKKGEAKGVCHNTVLERMKKRREQQNAAARKINKRSAPPPVIYANASSHATSRALMRKTSFAAGHCDRRTVKDLRPLPCISYKERLPCLAPPPRRLLSSQKTTGAMKSIKKTTTTTIKTKSSGNTKNWANDSKKARSPKKEYIRRIPLV